MSTHPRWGGPLTVLLATCSAAIAVTGVILGAETDGPAGASASAQPAIARTAAFAKPATAPTGAKAPIPAGAGTATAAGAALWVDPSNPAAKASGTLLAQGRTADAAVLAEIASRPTATWLTGDAGKTATTVSRVLAAATAARQVPVLVTYYLPNRDCGGYSSGGASSPAVYQSWVRSLAAQLGAQPAVVIVEPDAVAMLASHSCASVSASSRQALLADEVSVLRRQPRVSVYLDAGNSHWVSDTAALAAQLKASGLGLASGFALNVSNFRTLPDSLDYGNRISAVAGGAHFVVDTSRNGAGPLPANSGYRGPSWCNPPGRALGTAPNTRTGLPRVDAYLWIKYPGASDGSCGLGDPPAGTFWPDYALGLARRS